MESNSQILQLCRLCLDKDSVNIPIFEEHDDIRQIYLKISSCLPVKVSRDDRLPKKICDGCSHKLDLVYEFRNTSVSAEKQLLEWLEDSNLISETVEKNIEINTQQNRPTETQVKQEEIDPSDIQKEEDEEDDKNYLFEQSFQDSSAAAGSSATNVDEEEEEPPPPKRAKRTAAVKAAIAMDQSDDDDEDYIGEPLTKVEDESEDSEGEDQETPFVDVPSTSADDQPGPSGVGKEGEAPENSWACNGCTKIFENFGALQDHLANIQEAVQYFCNIHKKYFEREADHECSLEKRCAFCFRQLKDDHKLHSCFHIYSLSDIRKCNMCYRKYSFDRETCHLNAHGIRKKKKKLGEGRTGGQCKKCRLKFSTYKEYYQHRYKKHYKKKERTSSICHICGKVYSSNTIAEHVKNIHTKKRNYKCNACGKCFANKYKLDRHQIVHSNEFKYQCGICHKMFKMVYSLQVHTKMHINKIYFDCIICSKRFSTKQSRDNHLKKHGP